MARSTIFAALVATCLLAMLQVDFGSCQEGRGLKVTQRESLNQKTKKGKKQKKKFEIIYTHKDPNLEHYLSGQFSKNYLKKS